MIITTDRNSLDEILLLKKPRTNETTIITVINNLILKDFSFIHKHPFS